jgi:hypothetical protein
MIPEQEKGHDQSTTINITIQPKRKNLHYPGADGLPQEHQE